MLKPPTPIDPRSDPFQHAFNNTSKLMFKRLAHFSLLSSTNTYTKRLATMGEPEGLIVLADEQSSGIGRLGRSWHSPLGGLYFSLLIHPKALRADETPLITLTTGLAIAKVLRSALGLDATLKWPNDVLIRNRKLAGILVESSFIGNQIKYAVIGIGINANTSLTDFPKSLQPIVTTLQDTLNRKVDTPRLFGYLVGQLEFWYLRLYQKGFKAIRPHYRKLCTTLGKKVIIDLGETQLIGLAKNLEPDGSLIIQTSKGRQIIRSADVISSKSSNEGQ